MNKNKRILFITKGDGLSGVPVLLLHLIRWYADHVETPPLLIERGGGPLLSDYRVTSRVYVAVPIGNTLIRILNRISLNIYLFAFCLFLRIKERPSVIFASELNISPIALLAFKGIKLVSGCHMLKKSLIINDSIDSCVSRQIKDSSLIVCCANTVKESLLDLYPFICPSILAVVPEYINVAEYDTFAKNLSYDDNVRHDHEFVELGSTLHQPLFVMCGPATHRKGFDYLVPLAKAFSQISKLTRFTFLWFGATIDETHRDEIETHAELLGVSSNLVILPPARRFRDILIRATAFCLLSREDPMPLVALEAAALRVPIACFADSGDIPYHFVGSSGEAACYVSPMGDTSHMAHGLYQIYCSSQLRSRLVLQAFDIVSSRNTLANCESIYNLIGTIADFRPNVSLD